MRFLRTAVIALGATQAAALSSKDIVIAIDGITEISAKTTEVAKDIDLSNLFQSIPELIGDFKDIVVLALQTIQKVSTSVVTSKFEDSEQTDVCQAFHDFVIVHQNLLQTVIGQGGILSKTPISAPLGAVLSVLEGGVDTLANSIIGLVPVCADQAKADLKALDATIEMTIDELASSVPGAKEAIKAANGIVKGITGGIGQAASSIIGIFTGQSGGPLGGLFGGSDGKSGGSGDFLGGLFGGGSDGKSGGSGDFLGGLFGGGDKMPNEPSSDSGSGKGSGLFGGLLGSIFGGGSGKGGKGDNGDKPDKPMPGSNGGGQGGFSFTFGPGNSAGGSSGGIQFPGNNGQPMAGNNGQPMTGDNGGSPGAFSYTFGSGDASFTGGLSGSFQGGFPNGPDGQKPSVSMDNMGGYYVCYHIENGMPNSMMTMKRRNAMQTPAPIVAMA
ncbi:hypothetical protein K4F52_009327 [Lecanicillium sp. MT-2017a]|nr:hypothetical protein K4F52_009327 [Lecanicillium sp. MT-2017a]